MSPADQNPAQEADWYACPGCGDEVRVGSRGCPKCQASNRSRRGEKGERARKGAEGAEGDEDWAMDGLREGDWTGDGLGLEDPGDFDYEEWRKKEFGTGARIKPPGLRWVWWVTGVLLVLALLAGWLGTAVLHLF